MDSILYEDNYQIVNKDLIESFYKKCKETLDLEINKYCLSVKLDLTQRINIFEQKEKLVLDADKNLKSVIEGVEKFKMEVDKTSVDTNCELRDIKNDLSFYKKITGISLIALGVSTLLFLKISK